MILENYTEEINTAEYPKYKAMNIAQKLNQDDPLNYYTILYTMTGGYVIEKFGIKGATK